jgi:hypothetical protein
LDGDKKISQGKTRIKKATLKSIFGTAPLLLLPPPTKK